MRDTTVLLIWLAVVVLTQATPQQGTSDQRSRYLVYYQRPSSEATSRQYSRQAQSYAPSRVRPPASHQQDTDDERQQVSYVSPVDASRYQSYGGVRATPQYHHQTRPEYGRPPTHSRPPPPPPPHTGHYGTAPAAPPASGGHEDPQQQQYIRVPQHLAGGAEGGGLDLASLFQRPGDEQQLAYLGQGAEGHRLQSGSSAFPGPRAPTRFQFVNEEDARPSGRPGQHSGGVPNFRPPVFPVEEGARFPSGLSATHQPNFGGSRETSGLRLTYPEDAVAGRFTGGGGGGHFGGASLSQFGAGAQQFEDLGGAGGQFGAAGFGGSAGGSGHFGGGLAGRGEAGRYGSGRFPFSGDSTRSASDVDEFTAAGSSPSEAEIGSDVLLELLKLKDASELTSRSQRRFVYVRQ